MKEIPREEFQKLRSQEREDSEALKSQYVDLAHRFYMAKLLMEFRPVDFMAEGRMPADFHDEEREWADLQAAGVSPQEVAAGKKFKEQAGHVHWPNFKLNWTGSAPRWQDSKETCL